MSISNGFANLCVKEYEITSCLVGICKNYCYKFQCTEMCPYHTFNFNYTCLERCPKEANFITTGDCEENCFSAEKTCHKECPESYRYHLNTSFFTWCLKKCPIYTHVNNITCELSCNNNRPYLYNNSCKRTCPDSHKLVYLHSSKFNEILMCTNRCNNLVLYQNRCISRCPQLTVLHNGICLLSCPSTHPNIYSTELHRTDVSLNQSDFVCVRECGSEYNIFNFTCIAECPNSAAFAHEGLCKMNVQVTNRITKNVLGNAFHLVHQGTFFLIIPTYVIIIVQKIFSTLLTKLVIQIVLKLIHLLLKEEKVLFMTTKPHTYQNYIMNA